MNPHRPIGGPLILASVCVGVITVIMVLSRFSGSEALAAPFAWLALLLCLTLATSVTGHHLRRLRRREQGRCVHCGYDLRGLQAGSACPECGRGEGLL